MILAGGKGLRLWPVSREAYPKQFVDIFGVGRTQLQQTFDRMLKLIPLENIFVSTYRAYTQLVEEQLPELPKQNILSEPIYRNTAPSTAWACYRVRHICKDANLVLIPSDQAVINEEAFLANIKEGFDFVDHNSGLLTHPAWRGNRSRRSVPREIIHREARPRVCPNVYTKRRVPLEHRLLHGKRRIPNTYAQQDTSFGDASYRQ